MTGCWPSSFFVCLGTETKSRSINSQKKERAQYPAILTEQTWSIKDLLYGFRGNFACGIQRVVPSRQDGSILPARVANYSARFRSFRSVGLCGGFLFVYLFVPFFTSLLACFFIYLFLPFFIFFFALSLCHSFYFFSILLEPEPKLFYVTRVNKLH